MYVRKTPVQDGHLKLEILAERLDAAVADDFREEVCATIRDGHRSLVLDLQAVQFMDSSGLGSLVACLRHLGPDGTMALIGITEPVERLLKLTRVNRVFDVLPEAVG